MNRVCRSLMLALFVITPFSLTQAQESNVKPTIVVLETNQGNIELTLFADKASKTVENLSAWSKRAITMV